MIGKHRIPITDYFPPPYDLPSKYGRFVTSFPIVLESCLIQVTICNLGGLKSRFLFLINEITLKMPVAGLFFVRNTEKAGNGE